MLSFNEITRDTTEAARKKGRGGNLLSPLPSHAGTDPLSLA